MKAYFRKYGLIHAVQVRPGSINTICNPLRVFVTGGMTMTTYEVTCKECIKQMATEAP